MVQHASVSRTVKSRTFSVGRLLLPYLLLAIVLLPLPSHPLLFQGTPALAKPLLAEGRIAFRRLPVGSPRSEIYVMNPDGTDQRLVSTSITDWWPSWAPDSRHITFASSRRGNSSNDWEISTMNLDGTELMTLTNNLSPDNSPSWSYDGTKIAFISYRDGNAEIYVMSADGSAQTRLTSSPESDWYPVWSPNGRRIAFETFRTGNQEIYLMNPDGSGLVNLTNHSSSDGAPSWSPDGSKIVFDSNRSGSYQIYVMDADGTNVRQITTQTGFWPAWSSDGEHIAFASFRDGNKEIYVIHADGTGEENLTNSPTTDDTEPAWTRPPLPAVQVSPPSGPQGTSFTQSGSGFHPGSLVTLSFQKPDTQVVTTTELADMSGAYTHTWTSDCGSPVGAYSYWADNDLGRHAVPTSFELTKFCFSISGQVTDAVGSPLTRVAILAGDTLTAVTGSDGGYSFTGLFSGTYTLTPTLTGYAFSPEVRSFSGPPSATEQDFVATWALSPTVSVSPASGPQGTSFTQSGSGFHPGSLVTLSFQKPDTQVVTAVELANMSGAYTHTWASDGSSQVGRYAYWADDDQGGHADAVSFEVANTAPTISALANQSLHMGQSTGPMSIIVGDANTPAGDLILTVDSSNPALVPTSAISFGGSGAERTLTITPVIDQSGSATITVRVRDGHGTETTTSFTLTVSPTAMCAHLVSDVNDPSGTIVARGQQFDKGWRIENCGGTNWGSDVQAVRTSGVFGPTSFNVRGAAGQTTVLTATVVAPIMLGTYRATYHLQTPTGQFGDPFWVEVIVSADATTLTITGRVTDASGSPLSGVEVSSGQRTTTTADDGTYILNSAWAEDILLTASKANYSFTPATRTLFVTYDVRGQDFVGVRADVERVNITVSLYNNPTTPDERAPYESILQSFADGMFEESNGVRKLGTVTIYTNKTLFDRADVQWTRICWPQANASGYGQRGMQIDMCDTSGLGFGLDFWLDFGTINYLESQVSGGYTLAHEWGHYYFSLYDEYQSSFTPCLPLVPPEFPCASDTPVEHSIMNQDTNATNGDYRWLNFSTALNNTRNTAQHRVYGASGWETLTRPPTQDPRDGVLTYLPTRLYYPDLQQVAPAANQAPRIDLTPRHSARSELQIVWAGSTASLMAAPPTFFATVDTLDSGLITYPAPLLVQATVQRDHPVIGAVAQGTLVAPDERSQPFTLRDDGVAPDLSANDGLYVALLPYTQNGAHAITIHFDNSAGVAEEIYGRGALPLPPSGSSTVLPDPVSITETFDVQVEMSVQITGVRPDDHADTTVAATALSVDNMDVAGKIDAAGDKDLFRIMVTESGKLVIRITNVAFGMQPRLRLLAADGSTELARGELTSPESGTYLFVTRAVAVGETLYAEVSHYDPTTVGGLYMISAGVPLVTERVANGSIYLPLVIR